jgi:hypothetical protein
MKIIIDWGIGLIGDWVIWGAAAWHADFIKDKSDTLQM